MEHLSHVVSGPEGTLRVRTMQKMETALRNYRAQQLRKHRSAYLRHRKRLVRIRYVRMRQLRDTLILIAIIIALFKDTLDLAFIGSLPGIGTIITLLFSILIITLLMIHSAGAHHRRARKIIARSGIMAAASVIEALGFGINFFPIETLTIIVMFYLIIRGRRAHNAKQRKKAKKARRAGHPVIESVA